MIIHVKKENGKVSDGRTLDECLRFLPNGDYAVIVESEEQWRRRNPRTLSQNALFYVWCGHIANVFNQEYGDDGWNKDNVHDFFCDMFRYPVALPDGSVIDKAVETSKLNKKQMTAFMNKIQSYMATEHGVSVPLPDDDKYADFKEVYG